MTICAWMPLWGRHEVLKIVLEGFRSMRSRWEREGHNLYLYVAWSDIEDLNFVLKNYGIPGGVCFAPNEPLSRKHNELMREAVGKTGADYFLQIGSDDVFFEEGDRYYFEAMEEGAHNVGCRSIFFADPSQEKAVKWEYGSKDANKLFGAGRLFSREAVEAAFEDGELWNKEANRSLDFISENRLIEVGYPPRFLNESSPFIVDIKSDTNIWGFKRYKYGEEVDFFELKKRIQGVVNL